MDILFVTSEAFPLIKTGGLADVSGSLPKAIKSLPDYKDEIKILIPAYTNLISQLDAVTEIAHVHALGHTCLLLSGKLPESDIDVIAVQHAALYERDGGPYVDQYGQDWPDNAIRFAVLSRIASFLASHHSPLPDWQPDIVHCNDWQTGLTPAYMKLVDNAPAKSIFSIHNMAYQGNFDSQILYQLELPAEHFTMDGFEFYDQVSYMKAGLYYADHLSTVSPTYAEEIQTEAYGFGLDGLLKSRHQDLTGILNGIDTDDWNPAKDKHLAHHYSARSLTGKKAIKASLQAQAGLKIDADAPLLGIVSRFAHQKGLDILPPIIPDLVADGCQFVILGSGDKQLEYDFTVQQQLHPDMVSVNVGYNEPLSHNIMAGSDMFIMPSRFEPCGLNQLYGLNYGTPPIVAATGGLADSVTNTTENTLNDNSATGFVIKNVTHLSLLVAIREAVTLWKQKTVWRKIQKNGMKKDVSWASSARLYLNLYKKILSE